MAAATKDSTITMSELLKAVKLMQKAQEKNIDLSSSNDSLLLEKFTSSQKKKSKKTADWWYTTRWTVYILLWIVGIVYLMALNHREALCQMLVDE